MVMLADTGQGHQGVLVQGAPKALAFLLAGAMADEEFRALVKAAQLMSEFAVSRRVVKKDGKEVGDE